MRSLISNALARAPATEKKKKKIQKLKALILVLGLLHVVGTVKIQKLKALILVLGLLQVVGTVKIQKLKALILVLGLLQVVGTVKNKAKATHFSTGPTTIVGTVKTKGTHFSTGPTTSSRHSKNKRSITYPNLLSATRPISHSDDIPVPTPPVSLPDSDSTSSDGDSNEDYLDYQPENSQIRHIISQVELNDLVRDLRLTKGQSESLHLVFKNGICWKIKLR